MSASLESVVKCVVRTSNQVVFAGSFLALVVGCGEMDPGTDTYESLDLGQVNADPKWSCLDEPQVPPTTFPETVNYTFPLVDWANEAMPLQGRRITVCGRADTGCTQPIDVIDVPAEPREVTIPLPAGENIYLLLTQPERVPELLYFAGPLYSDQVGGRIPLLTPPILLGLAGAQGVTLNLMQGAVALRAHDCNGDISGGATYELQNDATGVAYTVVSDLPTVTDLMPKATTDIPSESGNVPFAGFVNVAPGAITVSTDVGEQDLGEVRFFAPPMAITVVETRPIPWLN